MIVSSGPSVIEVGLVAWISSRHVDRAVLTFVALKPRRCWEATCCILDEACLAS